MKPDYIQTKVEQLIRDVETLRQKTTAIDLHIAMLDCSIQSLREDVTMVKDQATSEKISEEEKKEFRDEMIDEIGRLNAQELNQHKKTMAKTAGTVAKNEIDQSLDKVMAFFQTRFKFLEKGVKMAVAANNHNGKLLNRLIVLVDPDCKTFSEKESALLTRQKKRMVRDVMS